MIYFTRYPPDKSVKSVKSLLWELIGKIEECEEWKKKYLMVNDYTLDKLLDKFKKIDN